MKIDRVRLTPFALALRTPLRTAHGAIATRPGVAIEVEAAGEVGCGVASPVDGFGLEHVAQSFDALCEISKQWMATARCNLAERLAALDDVAPDAPVARSAADAALHDVAARMAGEPVAARLASPRVPSTSVSVHALLGAESPDALSEAATQRAQAGFRAVKLKVGARPFDEDAARLGAVRSAVPSDVAIRLDANAAWRDRAEALQALEAFAPHDVEWIEQPLAADALEDAAWLAARAPFPLAADESATDERSVARVLDAGAAGVVVVKPAACGGLAAAARIARRCQEAGVQIVVTSLLDSAIGVAAATHFAASLGVPGPVCGLATTDLFADDLCSSWGPNGGVIALPEGPGIGLAIDRDRLARLATGPAHEAAA